MPITRALTQHLVDWLDGRTYAGPAGFSDLKASGLFLASDPDWGSEDTGGTYRNLSGARGRLLLRDREGLFDPSNEDSPFHYRINVLGQVVGRNRSEFRHRYRIVRRDIIVGGFPLVVWQGWIYPPDDAQSSEAGQVAFPIKSASREELRRELPLAQTRSVGDTTLAREVQKIGGAPRVIVRADADLPPYEFGQQMSGRPDETITRREFLRRLSYGAATDSYENELGHVVFDPVSSPRRPINISALQVDEIEIDSVTRNPITDVEVRVQTRDESTAWVKVGEDEDDLTDTSNGNVYSDPFGSPLASEARWGRQSGMGFHGLKGVSS